MSAPWWITGLGVSHVLGENLDAWWQAVLRGDALPLDEQGMLALGDPGAEAYIDNDRLRRMDRASQLLAVAVHRALDHAGLQNPEDLAATGLCTSTETGTLENIVRFGRPVFAQGPQRANPMEFPNTVVNAGSGHACIVTGLRGHNDTLAGTGALAEAADALAIGRAPRMLAAGLEELGPTQRQLLAPGAPGAAWKENGQPFGEGAAALVLETAASAETRDARALALYGGQTTGFFPTAAGCERQAAGAARMVREALARAGVTEGHVDGLVVSAPRGLETAWLRPALERVLGTTWELLPGWNPAARLGQLLGAAESFAAASICMILSQERWPDNRIFSGRTVLLIAADAHGSIAAHLFFKSA